MSLAEFLTALFETGQVAVPPLSAATPDELTHAAAVIEQFEPQWRLELPGEPPALDSSAALEAAVNFYRACQAAVYRDLGEQAIAEALENKLRGDTPAVHYAVDLTFRFLPDLVRFARNASEHDPLVTRLHLWAARWPLSSVGMPDVEVSAIDGFASHPTLLRLYVDRILSTGDRSRLEDARIRTAVATAVGAHPKFAGRLANKLRPEEQTPPLRP